MLCTIFMLVVCILERIKLFLDINFSGLSYALVVCSSIRYGPSN